MKVEKVTDDFLIFRNAGQCALHVPHDGDYLRGDGADICPHD